MLPTLYSRASVTFTTRDFQMTRLTFVVVAFLAFTTSLHAEETISVLAWNIESGGNDSDTIAEELKDLIENHGPFDLIGLTEVSISNKDTYATAVRDASGFSVTDLVSNSGGGDRMMILYNEDRFERIQLLELDQHDGIALNFLNRDGENRFRSPFAVELQEENGTRAFFFMVNHLARNNGGDRNGPFRVQQAEGLREWARDQSLPIIMVGDQNFDYDISDDEGNASFVEFFRDDVWKWIKPDPLADTNFAADRNNPTRDRYPDSILDFIATANSPENWTTTLSEVIVRSDDFPDDGKTSDHRPLRAAFSSKDSVIDVPELLRRIRSMKRELEEMEALLTGNGQ